MAVYGPIRHQNKYYMDLRGFGPYNIFLVTDRSIYCHMTLSAMNYLLCREIFIYILPDRVLASSSEVRWVRFSVGSNIKKCICYLSTKYSTWRKISTKECWLGVQIMCPSARTCLLADCCFSELALWISSSANHCHLKKINCPRHD